MEPIYKDDKYTYYKIGTFKELCEIGSPSWKIKTEKDWQDLISKYPTQWVAVMNDVKNLVTISNNYQTTYNNRIGYIRYLISTGTSKDGGVTYKIITDNGTETPYKIESHTSYGVFSTVLNLCANLKKSYYEYFYGCRKIDDNVHKVTDLDKFVGRTKIGIGLHKLKEVYVILSKSYAGIHLICLSDTNLIGVVCSKDKTSIEDDKGQKFTNICGKSTMKIVEEYGQTSDSLIYCGVKLKLGLINIDKIKKIPQFVKKIDNWLVFDSDSRYLIVNTNLDNGYQVPLLNLEGNFGYGMKNPMFFYINKSDSQSHINKKDLVNFIATAIMEKPGKAPNVIKGQSGVD